MAETKRRAICKHTYELEDEGVFHSQQQCSCVYELYMYDSEVPRQQSPTTIKGKARTVGLPVFEMREQTLVFPDETKGVLE